LGGTDEAHEADIVRRQCVDARRTPQARGHTCRWPAPGSTAA